MTTTTATMTRRKRERPKRCDNISWAIGEFFKIHFTLQLLTRLYYRIMITCNNNNNNNNCNDSDDMEKGEKKRPKRCDDVSWALGECF